jgi:hypothetical protein
LSLAVGLVSYRGAAPGGNEGGTEVGAVAQALGLEPRMKVSVPPVAISESGSQLELYGLPLSSSDRTWRPPVALICTVRPLARLRVARAKSGPTTASPGAAGIAG